MKIATRPAAVVLQCGECREQRLVIAEDEKSLESAAAWLLQHEQRHRPASVLAFQEKLLREKIPAEQWSYIMGMFYLGQTIAEGVASVENTTGKKYLD